MAYLKKIFSLSAFPLFVACGVAVKDQESYHSKGNENGREYQFSLVSNSLFLSPEEEQCVATYPNLRAEFIREGVTISGVTGTSTFTYSSCDGSVSEGCLATTEFPAFKMDDIASKLAIGQTIGGVAGTVNIRTQADCSSSNQSDCIATATYQTMNLTEQGSGGASSLTSVNFGTKVTSSDSFEYWDASGNRNVSSGDADLTSSNLRSGVDIFGTEGPTDPLNCASISVGGTWIMVPGNPDYGTNDFCVMKYEAKCSQADGQNCTASMSTESPTSTAANTSWVSIDQQDSMTECASLGKGFHLVSNDERMTIAVNIANVASNWNNSAVGDSLLNRGHSDNDPAEVCAASSNDTLNVVETDCTNKSSGNDDFVEKRTHALSNGAVIWDFAGNAGEWVDYFNDVDKATPVTHDWYEYSLPVVGTTKMPLTDLIPQIAIDNGWDSTNSIGKYLSRPNGGDRGGMRRGGNYYRGDKAGVFSTHMQPPTYTSAALGFRCAVSIP